MLCGKREAMFSDFKFRGYCIYVLLTYVPIVVHTLKECSKKDVCICSTDEGVIDLRGLAGTGSDIPRFKDVADKFGTNNAKLSWNPCNKWTQQTPAGTQFDNCKESEDVAVCYNAVAEAYINVGEQKTADYSYNETSGTCVLTLKGQPFPNGGPASTSTLIFLQCDPHEEGRLESQERTETQGDEFKVFLNLHTKYACVKSGLSVGSILDIIFISLLVVYLVAGILFNKYSKGATGKELIPNVNFWIDFPFLVKDGAVFSFQCCRSFCSRKQSSYAAI